MSRSNIIIPPFTEEEDEVVVVPPSSKKALASGQASAPVGVSASGDPKNPKKRSHHDGPSADECSKKLKNPKDTVMPPPPPAPPANVVANTFAKLGHQNVSEVDLNGWTQADFEENNAMLTKSISEAFVRQASRQKEIRALFSSKNKLEKEVDALRYKLEAAELENSRMKIAHKKHVDEATDSLKTDLRDARKKIGELESARIEDGKKIIELEGKVAALEAERAQAVIDAKALGQVQFMRSFMKKLPEFDWYQLGEPTGKYADDLRAKMAEEAQKKLDEAEARRIAEETENREATEDTPAS